MPATAEIDPERVEAKIEGNVSRKANGQAIAEHAKTLASIIIAAPARS